MPGRSSSRWTASLADIRPEKIGPLGGLEAALAFAVLEAFDAVLSVPVDTLPLPKDLRARLEGVSPATFERQHLIGYWPVGCAKALSAYLASGHRSVVHWKAELGARVVPEPYPIANVNVRTDLSGFQAAGQYELTPCRLSKG